MVTGLGGAWQAAVADEALRRAYPDPAFDDSSWAALDVPGHWRSAAEFESIDGPVLYRKRFEAPDSAAGARHWLVFDGVFYQSDVWLDGSYVGDTEGYFFPHAFEVTDALADRSEHVLAVEVACNRPGDLKAKRNITGVFQHWDCLDPAWNPGGIWRDVRIESSGPVRISRLRMLCGEASAERALLSVRAVLNVVEATTVCLRTTVGGTEHSLEQPVAAGENRVTWNVAVEKPQLWWPWSLGPQQLVDVDVSVSLAGSPEVSDRRSLRTGLRQVRAKNWVFSVNGERLFLKGSNIGPTRMELADAAPAEFGADVAAAKSAGLDVLRVHGHISRPELYAAADEAGMLLWQDFPLQWGYARGIRKQAARQAREAVDLLGHHPSIALWCGHNQPVALEWPRPTTAKQVLLQQVPTWNKTLLDSSVKRSFERSDSSRPVVPHSGVLPGVVSGGTDSHLYFGWYHGRVEDMAGFLARWPRLARFVSEFGAQAVPSGPVEWLQPSSWPDLDWSRVDLESFSRVVPPADYESFDEWREATQRYQAEVVRRSVETVRRLKYRPSGGFCQFLLADAWPAVTWSVLGHDRAPKLGYDALAAACAPVIVVADALPPAVSGGDTVALDVHVVSDLRAPVEGAVVTAVMSWPGGSHRWAWKGDVDADACTRIETISFVVPDGVTSLTLDLEFDSPAAKASNRYTTP
jgi:beta-mannosidase